jgi:hypothetical protein
MDFEGKLFNLFTLDSSYKKEFIFSQRRRIVKAMIAAMEAEAAIIRAEREAQMAPPKEGGN